MSNRIINVSYGSPDETEKLLSNLAPTPFTLDEKDFASVEGFWQGIKFPEESEERARIFKLSGLESKRAGNSVQDIRELTFNKIIIAVGSPNHHELMRLAIRAKLAQNPYIQKLLVESGDARIIHELRKPDGTLHPDSKTIPAKIFAGILEELRREFTISSRL